MYWKIEALTAKRTEVSQTFEGSLEDVRNQAMVYGLEILNIYPDWMAFIRSIYQNRKLSSESLCVFFNDFENMQRCGLSINESVRILIETTSNSLLKQALVKVINYLQDGHSLEESFENTRIFPKIVCVSLNAAEKTGNIPEILALLGEYYKFKHENNKKIINSSIYPAVIFCMLIGLSIFISLKLVPQLKAFLPEQSCNSLSARLIIDYAYFIKDYWWLSILLPTALIILVKYYWNNHKENLMRFFFNIPLWGNLLKNLELSQVFMNLYIYQKSGVNIIETIDNIYESNKTYITQKLVVIRDEIFKGASLSEAFKKDPFFPSLIHQNLLKSQASGTLPEYLRMIHNYYNIKTKESIERVINAIGPSLLMVTSVFLIMIACAFILPIYSNMSQLGDSVFK